MNPLPGILGTYVLKIRDLTKLHMVTKDYAERLIKRGVLYVGMRLGHGTDWNPSAST